MNAVPERLLSRPEIRRARPADAPEIARSLAAGFYDDPVARWSIPSDRRRFEGLERWFVELQRPFLEGRGELWTTGDRAGGALWNAPGAWRASPGSELRVGLVVARAVGWRLPLVAWGLRRLESRHPRQPHWYLSELAVRPESQGRGLGSLLMKPVLDRCDEQGVPAYLESSTERSRALYERHGFRVTSELWMPRGGPPLWLMWREPRRPGSG